MSPIPARLNGAPKLLLEHARKECGGDWSRVTFEHGSITIHNKTVYTRTEIPMKAPPRRRAAKKADPPVMVQMVPPKVEQAEKPKPRPLTMVPRTVEAPPKLEKYDKAIPSEFDIRDAWENLDATRVASSILKVCFDGLPESLPLDMNPDVLALEGINFDLAVAAVRNPHYVEVAGKDTKLKGYPVLRFTRGDIMVVVGLRELRVPMMIAIYAQSRLDADQHRVGSVKGGGGGGARKATGLPKTSPMVISRLRSMGADVLDEDVPLGASAMVVFRGQELGRISTKADRATCETDYQRCIRKMEAISRRG